MIENHFLSLLYNCFRSSVSFFLMDPLSNSSMDSCFHSSNFMDLLESQNQNHMSQGYVNPIVDLGSSQVPQFNESRIEDVREGRKKWTPKEDIVLCSAWLNTSKDAVVANEQKQLAFWSRVFAYYDASPNVKGYPKRDAGTCKQRWHRINEQVTKFVGSYAAAKRQQKSGENEEDVVGVAYDIFAQDHKQKFTLTHAWIELKNDQKWRLSIANSGDKSGNSSKKRKLDDQITSSDNTMGCEEHDSRPEGVKAAKRKGKAKASNTNSDFVIENAWKFKEKDNLMKQKLSKLSLLQSLIEKSHKEPLDDMENSLKEMLIKEVLL